MNDYLSRKIRIVSLWAIAFVLLQHGINFTGYIDKASAFGTGSAGTLFQYAMGYGVARPAVALFFLLSGFLFFRNYAVSSTLEKYRSRFRSVVLPYLLWNVLAVGFVYAIQLLPGAKAFFASLYTGYLPGKPIGELARMALNHGAAFPLWFLSDLMLYILAAPVIYFAVRYLSWAFVAPLILLWIAGVRIPPELAFLERGGVFYFLGAWCALRCTTCMARDGKRSAIPAVIAWAAIIVGKSAVALTANPWVAYLPVLDNLTVVIGALAVWFAYDALALTRFTVSMERHVPYVFFVFAAHEPLLELLKITFASVFGTGDLGKFGTYIFSIVGTYTLTVLIAITSRKYLPSIYGALTGSR